MTADIVSETKEEISVKTLCIYHGNCADGFTAAWAVRKALGEENVDFYAGTYQNPPPDVTGRNVVLVDFSYKYDVLAAMSYQARSILVLDHHKTAADDLGRLPAVKEAYGLNGFHGELADYCQSCNMPHIGALFDMERSGAQIAWDFFHPGVPRPNLVDYVGDRDLWKFVLPHSREVNAYVFAHAYDFRNWDYLDALTRDHMGVQRAADMGGAIEKKHHKDVAELVAVMKRRMVIGGHDVPVANLPYTLTSDAGHLMAQGEPFAACYWDTPEGRVFSLRSVKGGMDVSAIAKLYGGGGHENAAGFRIQLDTHP